MPAKWTIALASATAAHDLMTAADAFGSHLIEPVLRYGSDEIEVEGSLAVDPEGPDPQVTVACRWRIGQLWRVQAPTVFCSAAWITRKGADWHRYRDGSFCYVHPQQWRDCFRKLVDQVKGTELVRIFADFAHNNLRWLLQRHLDAHRWNLSAWPPAWPQWLHGDAGDAQYRREGGALVRQVHFESETLN
jgi:hypothetical protein